MKLTLRAIYLFLLLSFSVFPLSADNERTFRVINAANDLADNSAQIVTCTKTGRMIISTIGNLNFYDGASFSHIDTRQEYQYQLPLYKGNYRLYFDRKHHIWLKNTYTVTCVDLLKERFVQNVDSVFQQVLDCQELIQDIFTDNMGNIWALTEKGLYSVEQKKYFNVLRDRNLQDVDVYNDKVLLTFYDNGEEVGQDINTGRIVHRTKAYEWDDAENYTSFSVLLNYKDGYFQVRNGEKLSILLYFDLKSLQWSVIARMPYHMNNIAIEEGHDVLYIPSEYGYWTYDIRSHALNHIEELTLNSGKKLQTDCNTLAFDKQGGMWIGTEKRGLLYARPVSSKFNAYTREDPQALKYAALMDHLSQNITEFNGKQANCMYTDSRNWTWFGTISGLYMYRTPKSTPEIFTRKQGLLNNVIHSIVEDKNHNMWISTSSGISCIMFEGDKPVFVNSFNQDDNVPNESFINCKALCLDDGTIIMQALDHVISFHPKDFEQVNGRKPFKLYPKLVKLMVNGNTVEPEKEEDGNIIIDRAITRTHDISLNANQNTVSLTFSGLNYFRPLQTFYRVRVTGKGIVNEWKVYSYYNSDGMVDSKGMLHLPLLGLQPGDYRIEVQASMFPDVWPGTPFDWVIHVNQPWWRTTGVYMILLVIILALLIVNFYFYSRNMKMRARRNNEEGDMIRKVKSFVERCDMYSAELLSPTQEELYSGMEDSARLQLTPNFIGLMLKLIPYIQQHKTSEITMNQLSKVGGIDIVELYDIISGNLYKSPRELIKQTRLERAATLLAETDKSIEEIANECGFYTPNYFIGSFFHEYKVTPREYREEKRN